MALVEAKCSNCGANLKVDSENKSGVCEHCGANFITNDIIINNITNTSTNINYSETIDGVTINRNAVLEKLLLEYYAEKFNDIDNLKEYALKVLEYDIKNLLANFVVFKNIDSKEEIKILLKKTDLNISLDLFITLINICGDNINDEEIIKNIVKYKSKIDSLTLMEKFIDKVYVRDIGFVLNFIYQLKFTEDENNKILDMLYDDKKTNKIIMLAQLKSLKIKHNDFQYDQQKFDNYLQHWKEVKEKQIKLSKRLAEEEKKTKNQLSKMNEEIKQKENKVKKRQKTFFLIASIFTLLVLIMIIFLIK